MVPDPLLSVSVYPFTSSMIPLVPHEGAERLPPIFNCAVGVDTPIPTFPVKLGLASGANNVSAQVIIVEKFELTCVASAMVPLVNE